MLIFGFKTKSWFCYGVILLSLALSEAMLAPTQALGGDNTWHFKWASDLLAANPIFWSGVDANRIFPDLLFSLIAAALPGGQFYDVWVIYFCCVSGFSLGLSLILLSRPLFSESSERIVFFAVSCAVFVAVTTLLSFWSFWIMAPGNHGGSLSTVIAATALFLMNVRAKRINPFFLVVFALICTFLVMSNRYLVVCLMVPLLVATLSATQDRRRQIVLVSATLLSTAAGVGLLHLLNSSNFYRLVAPGGQPSTPDLLSLIWWEGRIPKEFRELANSTQRNQIMLGLAIMGAAAIAGFWLPFRRSDQNSTLALRRIFRLIVASSAVCAALFVTVIVDNVGNWHYRFFVIPFCLAVIAVSAIAVYAFGFKGRAWLVAVCLSVLSLVMASMSLSFDISSRTYEAQFRTDLRQLSRLLADHDGMTIHDGFGNYWIANEVSVRSADIRVLTVAQANYRFYNDNAWELCSKRAFSFILVWEEKNLPDVGANINEIGSPWSDRPNVGVIVKQIGPPSSSERIQLGRFGPVQVLFYHSELLDKAIVQPGRVAAREEFSNFQCPKSSAP